MSLGSKLRWVAVLYFAQGFPFGIAIDNIPVYFRSQGVSLAEVGLLSLLGAPWTLKVLWAPAIDRFGSRRHWIGGSLLCMALLIALVSKVVAIALFLFAAVTTVGDLAERRRQEAAAVAS